MSGHLAQQSCRLHLSVPANRPAWSAAGAWWQHDTALATSSGRTGSMLASQGSSWSAEKVSSIAWCIPRSCGAAEPIQQRVSAMQLCPGKPSWQQQKATWLLKVLLPCICICILCVSQRQGGEVRRAAAVIPCLEHHLQGAVHRQGCMCPAAGGKLGHADSKMSQDMCTGRATGTGAGDLLV